MNRNELARINYYNNREKILEKQKVYRKNKYANDPVYKEKALKYNKLKYYSDCITKLLVDLEITEKRLEVISKEPIEINCNYYRIPECKKIIKELQSKIEIRINDFHNLSIINRDIIVV
jgi:hypothetical protein